MIPYPKLVVMILAADVPQDKRRHQSFVKSLVTKKPFSLMSNVISSSSAKRRSKS